METHSNYNLKQKIGYDTACWGESHILLLYLNINKYVDYRDFEGYAAK